MYVPVDPLPIISRLISKTLCLSWRPTVERSLRVCLPAIKQSTTPPKAKTPSIARLLVNSLATLKVKARWLSDLPAGRYFVDSVMPGDLPSVTRQASHHERVWVLAFRERCRCWYALDH